METVDLPVWVDSREYLLTSFVDDDIDGLVHLLNLPSVALNLLTPPYPYTAADAASSIKEANADNYALPGSQRRVPSRWAIRTSDRALIGSVGAKYTAEGDALRLGYFLDEAYAGRGIMSAVVRELVNLFRGIPIRAEVILGNEASERILLKNGVVRVADSLHSIAWPESKGGGTRSAHRYEKLWS